jgi:UDPglucose 6-dehydrogenase
MRLCIVGTGYVGLVAGTCFADSGNDVTCVDIDQGKVERLRRGELPIYEPGLEDLVRKNLREKRLSFSTDLAASVTPAQAVFIAVGTPEGESGDADLKYVLAAAREIGRAISAFTLIVNKSTVPVGTAERVRKEVAAVTQVPFEVVSNPEFLKEGSAIEDFLRPDRVVIGTKSPKARQLMEELYAPFVRTENPLVFMDTPAAELTKYAANAMLAARISFMNDVALLCEKVGADVNDVRKGLGADKRIGYSFLHPGIGYGGSCFPKDVKALTATAREVGLEFDLLRAVENTNARQKRCLLSKALKHFGDLSERTFAVWGLAFKPKTDDMREAPSVELIEGLLGKGARVQCHDPVAIESARRYFGDRVLYAPTCYAAAEGADALFLVTEWSEFRHPDMKRLKATMKSPTLFDGRNVIDPRQAREEGFTYFGIGRTA